MGGEPNGLRPLFFALERFKGSRNWWCGEHHPAVQSLVLAYERLLVWQEAHKLTLTIYRITAAFPPAERYGLTSQTQRAAVSVAANIAEGAAKRGSREFRRFLDIAMGSMSELTYLLRLSRDLELIPITDREALEDQRRRTSILLWRLYQVVSKRGRDITAPKTVLDRPRPS